MFPQGNIFSRKIRFQHSLPNFRRKLSTATSKCLIIESSRLFYFHGDPVIRNDPRKKPIEFSKISHVWWTREAFYRFLLSETEDYWSKKLVSEGVLRLIARVEAREKSERANEARDKIKLKQKCLPRHSLYLLNPSLTLCNPDDDYCDESVKLYQRNYLLTGYGW